MAGVHEVGCGMHRTVRRGHVATGVAWVGISTIGGGGYTVRSAATNVAARGVVATTTIATNGTACAMSAIAHGCVIAAADLGGNASRTRRVAATA